MNDDLIRRQDAIRAYCEHECGKGMIRGTCGCDDCGTIFDDISSAQPEVLAHGEGELSAQPEQPFKIQEILDYLDTELHPIISPEHWNVYSELHDMISTLSSIQPERKKGKWIDTGSGQECSVCGEIQYGYDNFRRFCGNCGSYNGGDEE